MMAYGWKKVLLGAAFVLSIGAGVATQAETVTFSDINTATGEFGAVTHGDDTLDIDVSAFLADTSNLAQGSGVAFDTIAFLVTADPGYTITAIKYTEGGLATANASSFASAAATWVVGGLASSMGYHVFSNTGATGTSFTLSSTTDVRAATSLLVSITNSLFAFGTSATVGKNLSLVEVTTASIPEPTSVLFLLAGLAVVAVFVATRRLD
jgi:hypothetical protein